MKGKSLNLCSLIVAAMLSAGLPVYAGATVIDFEGGASGTAVGSDYSGSGVVFTNAYYTTDYGSENGSSTWATGETSGLYNGVGNVAMSGYFTGTTDYISAQIIYADWAATTSSLVVYDSSSSILAFTILSSSTTPYSLSISTPGIASFVFAWQGGGSGGYDDVIGIDNLTFNTVSSSSVPEPSTLLLLGSGLAGFAVVRMKRFRKG
ncbi:MAG: PEP-CTERM sorting domain-containing protein [Deltaproteobacteria bacterium]|nr:PEP-CTERM sorting domain-containing protein [Deltaproteobacteria bacterium]